MTISVSGRRESTARIAEFCMGPLARAIMDDLRPLEGFYPSDAVRLALQLLDSEVDNPAILELVLADGQCTLTRDVIREAFGQTILYHHLMRGNNNTYVSESLARAGTAYSERDVLTSRVISEVIEKNGFMDIAVKKVVSEGFDRATFSDVPVHMLVQFFWKTFDVETTRFGQIILD